MVYEKLQCFWRFQPDTFDLFDQYALKALTFSINVATPFHGKGQYKDSTAGLSKGIADLLVTRKKIKGESLEWFFWIPDIYFRDSHR